MNIRFSLDSDFAASLVTYAIVAPDAPYRTSQLSLRLGNVLSQGPRHVLPCRQFVARENRKRLRFNQDGSVAMAQQKIRQLSRLLVVMNDGIFPSTIYVQSINQPEARFFLLTTFIFFKGGDIAALYAIGDISAADFRPRIHVSRFDFAYVVALVSRRVGINSWPHHVAQLIIALHVEICMADPMNHFIPCRPSTEFRPSHVDKQFVEEEGDASRTFRHPPECRALILGLQDRPGNTRVVRIMVSPYTICKVITW